MIAAPTPTPKPGGSGLTNPLSGIVPDFGIFGTDFTTIWQRLAAGLWALAILVAIGYLAHGILAISQSKGGHPGALKESRREAQNAGIALGGLIALGAIVTAFITVFGV